MTNNKQVIEVSRRHVRSAAPRLHTRIWHCYRWIKVGINEILLCLRVVRKINLSYPAECQP